MSMLTSKNTNHLESGYARMGESVLDQFINLHPGYEPPILEHHQYLTLMQEIRDHDLRDYFYVTTKLMRGSYRVRISLYPSVLNEFGIDD